MKTNLYIVKYKIPGYKRINTIGIEEENEELAEKFLKRVVEYNLSSENIKNFEKIAYSLKIKSIKLVKEK